MSHHTLYVDTHLFSLMNLNDTTDTNLGAEVEKSKVEETYTPEPEPTTTSNTTLKVDDTATSADELLDYISEQTGTTVQDKKSYTIELDSLIASSAREAFAQMIISKLGGVAGLATTETDATSSWISNTTVVSTNEEIKVILKTDTFKTTVVIFSNNITEAEATDAVDKI